MEQNVGQLLGIWSGQVSCKDMTLLTGVFSGVGQVEVGAKGAHWFGEDD